jgi:hypothetical protein
MSIKLYMDVHVRRAVTVALRFRGVDVLTAQEDGSQHLPDPALLDRSSALGRVLFTQDSDLLGEGTRRQRDNRPFGGVIYAHQLRISIGQLIDDLELMAKAIDPAELENRVEYLPLR